MSRETKKIIVCVTNKCPFCGERGYLEGEDSAKIGEKIKCEKCGKKFEVMWTRNVEGEKEIPYENGAKTDINSNSDMEKIRVEELQKRVEHLETEVELLKELVKLQGKSREDWYIPAHPSVPIQPYYSKDPTLKPPYKITCRGGEE